MADQTQLQKRLFSTFIFVPIAVFAIFFAPSWLFFIIVEAFIVAALLEYFALAERKGYFINRYLGITFAVLLPIQLYLPGETVVLTMALLSLCVYNFKRNLRDQALISTALTFFGIVYVAWCFSYLVKIRTFDHGPFWIFYLIFIVKMGDGAAYFVGKRFGRHKYAGPISPNKSIEGAIAGFIATFLLSLASKLYLPDTPVGHLLLLGVIIGVLSQIGDLVESLLKRDAGLKDSGAVPGLGGVLDMLDSLLPIVPVIYYYLCVVT